MLAPGHTPVCRRSHVSAAQPPISVSRRLVSCGTRGEPTALRQQTAGSTLVRVRPAAATPVANLGFVGRGVCRPGGLPRHGPSRRKRSAALELDGRAVRAGLCVHDIGELSGHPQPHRVAARGGRPPVTGRGQGGAVAVVVDPDVEHAVGSPRSYPARCPAVLQRVRLTTSVTAINIESTSSRLHAHLGCAVCAVDVASRVGPRAP